MTSPRAQLDEYRAAHEACAIIDLTARAQLRITGPDRVSYLQGMVTNDVEKLAVDSSCQVAMLTAKGAMVGDGRVIKLADELILDTGAGYGTAVKDFLLKYLISEEAEVADAPELAVLGLVGPKANEWSAALPSEAVVARLPGLFGSGVDVVFRREHRQAIDSALAALPTLSAETVEVLRVEAGVPKFGVDMTEATIPLEANLEKAIHYQKGCYIGQEVIARATYRGQMNKRLMGLTLGTALVTPGTEVKLGDRRVGRVTSVAHSELLGQEVALAYVHRDHLTDGTQLALADGSPVHVRKLPFAR